METVAWGFIERQIMANWFPGLSEKERDYLSKLESSIRGGGTYNSLFLVFFVSSIILTRFHQIKLVPEREQVTGGPTQLPCFSKTQNFNRL